MPLSYSTSEQERLIIIRAEGEVTTRETLTLIDEMLSDTVIEPGVRILIDGTEVKKTMPGAELREVAIQTKRLIERGATKIAILAPNDFVYGIGRIFSSYSEFAGVQADVFRNKQDACCWLDAAAHSA